MMIFYACDGEGPAIMELDDLIDNFLASEADVDVTTMRGEVEDRGWYNSFHDHGAFLVVNLVKYDRFLTLTPDAWDTFYAKGEATDWNMNHAQPDTAK